MIAIIFMLFTLFPAPHLWPGHVHGPKPLPTHIHWPEIRP